MSENKTVQVKVELCYLNLCCLSLALEVAACVISAVVLAGVSGWNECGNANRIFYLFYSCGLK